MKRTLSELSAEDRRRVLKGDPTPFTEMRLTELEDGLKGAEDRIADLERLSILPQLSDYITARIRRIEKHLDLPRFRKSNPLNVLRIEERNKEK